MIFIAQCKFDMSFVPASREASFF